MSPLNSDYCKQNQNANIVIGMDNWLVSHLDYTLLSALNTNTVLNYCLYFKLEYSNFVCLWAITNGAQLVKWLVVNT